MSRTSILPAAVEPPSLPAMGSAASRPAVAAAGTTRPTSAMETRCSRVRPQGPGCESQGYPPSAPRTAASPSPPLTQSVLRALPFFCLPTRHRGCLRGSRPIPHSQKAARERQNGKTSVPGPTGTNHSNLGGGGGRRYHVRLAKRKTVPVGTLNDSYCGVFKWE